MKRISPRCIICFPWIHKHSLKSVIVSHAKVRRTILSYGPADLFDCYFVFNTLPYALFSSSKRLVMLFKPVTRVEPLCRSAPVAGGSMPPTPSAIKSALKPMMKL